MKVTTPLASDEPLAPEMTERPAPWPSVTVLPDTGLPLASLRVTVTVEVVDPSAVTELGLAETVDWAAVTGPGVKVTVAVWVMTRLLSLVSVAV